MKTVTIVIFALLAVAVARRGSSGRGGRGSRYGGGGRSIWSYGWRYGYKSYLPRSAGSGEPAGQWDMFRVDCTSDTQCGNGTCADVVRITKPGYNGKTDVKQWKECKCIPTFDTMVPKYPCEEKKTSWLTTFLLSFFLPGADWFYLSGGSGVYIFAGIAKLILCGIVLIGNCLWWFSTSGREIRTEALAREDVDACDKCLFNLFVMGIWNLVGIWWLVDWMGILCGSFYNSQGMMLSEWSHPWA